MVAAPTQAHSMAELPTPWVGWLAIAGVAALSFFSPNTMELAGYVHSAPNFESDPIPIKPVRVGLPPEAVAIALGLISALVIARLPDPGIFLYFNF
jgi:hypothetical protein